MNAKNKYKFVAAVTGLFLVPFLLLSRHFVNGSMELRKNDLLRYSEMRTLAAARIFSNEINANYNLSRLTDDKKFLQSGTEGRKTAMALRVKESPFIYSELALLAASGRELCRASAGKDGKPVIDYGKTAVFEGAKKAAASAGAVEYGDYTPPALILVVPLETSGGKPEYYLAGRLGLAYLGELVRLMGKSSIGNFGLLDAGGQVIADSLNQSTVRPGIQAPPEIMRALLTAQASALQNFAHEVFFKGRSSLVSVSNVPGTKWWIYEIMETRDLPGSLVSSRVLQLVLSGIVLIIMFGFITFNLAVRWLVPGRQPEAAKPEEK
ncbi:MAG TPA: cache domain-containing protein [Elusimicrobiales bacterium]|nr:cache domain-containing protein [Elusimicrobiales bacterium]